MEQSNQFTFQQTCFTKVERATMITESRIEHVESLLKRAQKFERTEPKWDLFKIATSASGAVFLTILGMLIPIYLDEITTNTTALFILWLLLLVSAISSLLSFKMAKFRDENRTNEHSSYVEEMMEMVKKLKHDLDGENKV